MGEEVRGATSPRRTPDVERVLVFERLGKGEVGERELAEWMRG